MSKLSKLLGQAKEYTIGGEVLNLSPLGIQDIDILLDLGDDNKRAGAIKSLINKTLKNSVEGATDEEINKISAKYMKELMAAIMDINGVNVDSGAWATHHDGVNVYVTLFDRYDFASTTAGDMSLFRIGAGAPSADDIRAFYEDEKHLFANNAKCTLPGSSDVVNALAYNEWKNQLHVGTGAGKAIFKGLVNVEEDLTAAVTVIDALGENEVTD